MVTLFLIFTVCIAGATQGPQQLWSLLAPHCGRKAGEISWWDQVPWRIPTSREDSSSGGTCTSRTSDSSCLHDALLPIFTTLSRFSMFSSCTRREITANMVEISQIGLCPKPTVRYCQTLPLIISAMMQKWHSPSFFFFVTVQLTQAGRPCALRLSQEAQEAIGVCNRP